jgi:hypothetical protein
LDADITTSFETARCPLGWLKEGRVGCEEKGG